MGSKDLNTFLNAARRPYVGSELPMYERVDQASPDYQGIPQLSAGQLVRPGPFPMQESAGLLWFPISILDRKMRLFKPGERRTFNYVASPLTKDGVTIISRKLCSTGVGYIDLPRGEWLVNTPIVTAEGTQIECVLQDAALGNVYEVESSVGDVPAISPSANPNRDSFTTLQKTVAVVNTPENLAALIVPPGFALTIKAKGANTGLIGVGSSAAAANLATGTPFLLDPGESMRLFVKNATAVWIDAAVALEGVCYGAEI